MQKAGALTYLPGNVSSSPELSSLRSKEIVQIAQQFCDGEMTTDYFAGRLHAEWTYAKKTLERHKLIQASQGVVALELAVQPRWCTAWVCALAEVAKCEAAFCVWCSS